MGYHSSPAVAFLLDPLQRPPRLVARQPRQARRRSTARTATTRPPRLRPLLAEALGLSERHSPYVYLSDGGHFENLGLYEMVLRRCRYIVVSDAGEEPSSPSRTSATRSARSASTSASDVIIDRMGLFPRSLSRSKRDNPKYCAAGHGSATRRSTTARKDGTAASTSSRPSTTTEPQDIYNYATMNRRLPAPADRRSVLQRVAVRELPRPGRIRRQPSLRHPGNESGGLTQSHQLHGRVHPEGTGLHQRKTQLTRVSGFTTRTEPYFCPSERSSEYKIAAPHYNAA